MPVKKPLPFKELVIDEESPGQRPEPPKPGDVLRSSDPHPAAPPAARPPAMPPMPAVPPAPDLKPMEDAEDEKPKAGVPAVKNLKESISVQRTQAASRVSSADLVQGLSDDAGVPGGHQEPQAAGVENPDEIFLRNDDPSMPSVRSRREGGAPATEGTRAPVVEEEPRRSAQGRRPRRQPKTPLWWRISYWSAAILLSSGTTLYLIQSDNIQYLVPVVLALSLGIYWLLKDT